MKMFDVKRYWEHGIVLGVCVLVLCMCTCTAEEEKVPPGIRPSALAGTWYPGDPDDLSRAVDKYIQTAPKTELTGDLFGLIAPHAGYRYSGAVAGYAYRCVQRRECDLVIVMSPSHQGAFHGFSIMSVSAYQTPLGVVPLDGGICRELRAHKLHANKDWLHEKEHAIEIHLPFLQRTVGRFKLVPIVVGSLRAGDAAKIAAALKPHVSRRTLVVVSSDFTHYGRAFGYVPFTKNVEQNLRKLDMGAVRLIREKSYDGYMAYMRRKRPTICGRNAIAIFLKMLPPAAEGHFLKYDTSGRMTGDFRHSVSYVSMAFTYPSAKRTVAPKTGEKETPAVPAGKKGELTADEKRTLIRLARTTIEEYLETRRLPQKIEEQFTLTERLKERAGVFVTLKRGGKLRGCMGRIGYPEQANQLPPLYEIVMRMAVASATQDRRFRPVSLAELNDIEIEISVLTIAKEVPGYEAFEVAKHGIIIRKGDQTAVFLPQVAPEQGWDRDTTLQQLCRKAGLPTDEWKKPGMKFFVFTAQVFDETILFSEPAE